MRKAYSYVRFSTPDQAKGDSFRRQTEFSQRYAERHGLVLDESTSLRDLGVSAYRGSNVKEGALAGFLALVRAKRVPPGSVLIVESLDRLSRDQIRPALQLFLGILDGGVSIVTLEPEREYAPTDQDPLVLIEPLIYFARAHEESATKSRRVGESWDARRTAARGTGAAMTTVGPAWLRSEGGKFVPVPERVKVVADIFRWTLAGMGTFAVTKKLTADGVPGWGRNARWNTAYVRMILTDRRALGEYQPKKLVGGKMQNHGAPVPDYYPRVVSDADFYAALGSIRRRKGKAGRGGAAHENVLSGLVFNAEDGSKMYYGTHKFRKPFLYSTAGYYGAQRPTGQSFDYAQIESAVLTVVTELKPPAEGGQEPDPVPELEGRLREVADRIKRVEAVAAETRDFDTYLGTVARLEADKRRLAAEVESAKAARAARESTAAAETGSLIKLRRTVTGAERARLNAGLRAGVEALVESVWVLIENRSRTEKVAHVQVYLKGGGREYARAFFPSMPKGVSAPDYSGRDFKADFQKRK